jgi:hypothetical protein
MGRVELPHAGQPGLYEPMLTISNLCEKETPRFGTPCDQVAVSFALALTIDSPGNRERIPKHEISRGLRNIP